MPVFGYLDDLILLPLGIALALKLVPVSILAECRTWAKEIFGEGRPVSRVAGAVVMVIRITMAAILILWLSNLANGRGGGCL